MAFELPDEALKKAEEESFSLPEEAQKTAIDSVAKDESFNPHLHAADYNPGDEEYEFAYNVDKARRDRPLTEKVANLHPIDAGINAAKGIGRFLIGLPSVGKNLAQQAFYGATRNPNLETKRAEGLLSIQGAEQDAKGLFQSTAGKYEGALNEERRLRDLQEEAQLNALAGGSGDVDPAAIKKIQDDRARADFQKQVEATKANASLAQGKPIENSFLGGMASAYQPEVLQAEGAAPVDASSVENIRAFANPVNLALAAAPALPGAAKIGGVLTNVTGKALQLPMAGLERAGSVLAGRGPLSSFVRTAGAVGTGVEAGNILHAAIAHPTVAAGALGAGFVAKGAQKIGQALEAQGAEMASGIPSELTSRVAQSRLSGVGDLRALAGMKLGNAAATGAATAAGFAPLNLATSDGDPQKFLESELSAGGIGSVFSALKTNRPALVEAARPAWRADGVSTMDATSPIGQKSAAYIASLPKDAQDRIYETMGVLQGLKTKGKGGEEGVSQFYPLSEADYNAERAKLGTEGPQGRGFFTDSNGRTILNADIHQGSDDLMHTMGHEGGHVISAILNAAGSEGGAIWDGLVGEASKGLIKDGKPTEEFKDFIVNYNRNFDKTGKTQALKADDPKAIEEFLAEQSGRIIAGEGLDFALPKSIGEKIEQGVGRFAGKFLGIDTQKVGKQTSYLNKDEIGSVTQAMRDTLQQVARMPKSEGAQEPQAQPAQPVTTTAPTVQPDKLTQSVFSQGDVSKVLRGAPFNIPKAEADQWATVGKGGNADLAAIDANKQRMAQRVPSKPLAQVSTQPIPVSTAKPLASVTPAVEAPGPLAEAKPAVVQPIAEKPNERQAIPPVPEVAAKTESVPTVAQVLPKPEESTAQTNDTGDALKTAADEAELAVRNSRTARHKESTLQPAIDKARLDAMAKAHADLVGTDNDLVALRKNKFGKEAIHGKRLDPTDPFHQELLKRAGLDNPEDIARINNLQANLGKPIGMEYLSAPEEPGAKAAYDEALKSGQVAALRKRAQEQYSAGARADKEAPVRRVAKSYIPTGFTFNGPSGTLEVNGFSPDKVLSNASKLLPWLKTKGIEPYSGINDPKILEDLNTYAENHKRGWTGNGARQIKASELTPNVNPSDSPSGTIPKDRFDALNAMMGDTSAFKINEQGNAKRNTIERTEKELLASMNSPFFEEATGETNFIRDLMNKEGDFAFKNTKGEEFTGKHVLENANETLRPELIENIGDPNIKNEHTIRPVDFTGDLSKLSGRPRSDYAAAGFMPESVDVNFREALPEERKKLGIPPAWTNVKINPDPEGRLLATGRDQKGRKQARYSVAHTSAQQAAKFSRGKEFNDALPDIMQKVEQDIADGNEEAAVLRLIYLSGFRNGGDKNTGGAVKAYGASNLTADHVSVDGDTVNFDFTGKLGVKQQHAIRDAALAKDIQERAESGGRLFDTNAEKVRAYLQEMGDFKVHDFRTWNATDLARREIAGNDTPKTPEEFWDLRDKIGDTVAKKLGDTRKIALDVYIDPTVFEPWKSELKITNDQRPKKARKKASKDGGESGGDESVLRDQFVSERYGESDSGIGSSRGRELTASGFMPEENALKSNFMPEEHKQDELGFYSGLASIVKDKIPNRASPEQILATLKSNGAKQEEMESMGLPEFLKSKNGPVTKHELQDFVKAGGVQLKEVIKTQGEKDNTKFSQYQLPGGTNYKEVLLTLPEKNTDKGLRVEKDPDPPRSGPWRLVSKDGFVVARGFATEEAAQKNAARVGQKITDAPARQDFKSSHWDEPNVLAHTRQADHVDTEGNKVRLIEEIQSDWHQKGRKDGYKTENTPEYIYEVVPKDDSPVVDPEFIGDAQAAHAWVEANGGYGKWEKIRRQNPAARSAVPDAPFKKTWAELAFKRALRMAVEDGVDKIAWTEGKVHTDRWGTERIEWAKQNDGSYLVNSKSQHGGQAGGVDLEGEANARNLNAKNSKKVKSQKEMEDAIRPSLTEGQDAAKLAEKLWGRMQAEESGVSMPRKEGFEGFYDKILPDFVRKYVKKWGGKVEATDLGDFSGDAVFDTETQTWELPHKKINTVHSVTITPEMRKAIMAGQPMFMPEGDSALPPLANQPEKRTRMPVLPLGTLSRDDVAKEKKGPLAGLLVK